MDRDPLRTARAEELFCGALEHEEPEARRAFLDDACAGDSGMRNRVERLLAAHEKAGGLFAESDAAFSLTADDCLALAEDPAVWQSAALDRASAPPAGTKIGSYRLIEVLGQGGCGVVYLAEQEHPIRRQVALKIIKLGMDTEAFVARFNIERQALAMMDHPHIARVLDAGATETGRPYLVMELVRGTKITRFCDQHRLDLRRRLELFSQVCIAVQHAHQKGVIHRDIKPSNVLVALHDGVPRPIVIDFGVAKAVEGKLTDETLLTPCEHFIGTPAYMSPEQAQISRLDVDTRSDIYSLGVLLHELLTGRTPFDTTKLLEAGVDEMRRVLRDQEPLRPSALFAALPGAARSEIARLRQSDPSRLATRLCGDLDWITTKALEKDRDRRYQTANDFVADVRRHLGDELVSARPPSRLYRLRKLVRRHRAAFAAGAAITLTLAAGLGVTTVLLLRERELRKEQARLRAAAERGLKVEGELRRQAEWREGIRQVAAAIQGGDLAEADMLAARLPSEPATLEGSDMLRTLGEWNALRGDWTSARKRYLSLLRANRYESVDSASLDMVAAGVSIVKSGDLEGYRLFCRQVAVSAHDTSDPMIADRVLKSSLLLPPTDELLEILRPFARLAETCALDDARSSSRLDLSWRCQTLALLKHRDGHDREVNLFVDPVLAAGERPVCRSASVRLIRAMARWRLGESEGARQDLEEARAAFKPRLTRPLRVNDPEGGFWFDWVIAELLLNEAEALIEQAEADG